MKLLPFTAAELKQKLDKYLAQDPHYQKVYTYSQQRFDAAPHLSAHNFEHAYRDTLNAIVIGEAEGADMRIVLPATTMHDIGFLYGATGKTHGSVGADKLEEFLKDGSIDYSPVDIEKMASCIRTHKGSMHGEVPESLEARVVADADMLEKFGPFGIYSTIRTFGEFGYPLELMVRRTDMLSTLTLETPTGQKLAEPGRQFVLDFYTALAEAAEPYLREI